MSTLDDLLRSPDTIPQDPIVGWLKSRKSAGDVIWVELRTDHSPLATSVTGLIVMRKTDGVEQPPQIYDWDDDLNTAMINMGIKALDLKQEGMRFARVLRFALRKVERRYGDGYMNGVLLDLIDDSNLGKDGELGKVRPFIHSIATERKGRSYNECRDVIAMEIGGRAKELRDDLQYNPEELKLVMDRAIAQYLDERFSITSFRRLSGIDERGRTTE